jgi:hypothetical protein
LTEFNPIESKIDNLAQHLRAIGVSAGVPASGKRDHVK